MGNSYRGDSRSGFSVIELLIVASIIAFLVALSFPVYMQARKESQKTICASNMRQVWMAAMLYRVEYDGEGKYGSSAEMGLPPKLAYLVDPRSSPESVLRVKGLRCSSWPSKFSSSGYSYSLQYQDSAQMTSQNRWDDYAREFEERSIFVTDVNHNDNGIPLFSPTIGKVGLGVNLMGSLIKLRKPGDPDILRWWTTPCTTHCPLR